MAQRETNTFAEWLDKTLSQVQLGKKTQDALMGDNYDFVTELETMLLARLHQPVDQVTGQQPGGGGPLSQVPVPGPGAPQAGPIAPGPGMGGGPLPMGGSMPVPGPSADELSRVLGAQAQ